MAHGLLHWGKIIIIRRNFQRSMDIVIQHEHCDLKGRLIVLNAKIKDKNYFLINLYGPNKDAEAVRFYQDLSTTLRGIDLDSDSNVIVGGDFNCPLDPTIDKKGGILIPRQHVINSIENIQNEFGLHDIWRIKNPNTRSYTWSNALLSPSADLIIGLFRTN